MVAPDPHGQVALMLYESLLHVLVEEGVVPREKVIEAIDLVADLVRDRAQTQARGGQGSSPAALIERIAITFAAKD
jgi:hypothetical protein